LVALDEQGNVKPSMEKYLWQAGDNRRQANQVRTLYPIVLGQQPVSAAFQADDLTVNRVFYEYRNIKEPG